MKRIAILTAALLLAGCGTFSKLGLVCYIPPAEHGGQCTLFPAPAVAPAAAASTASGVSV